MKNLLILIFITLIGCKEKHTSEAIEPSSKDSLSIPSAARDGVLTADTNIQIPKPVFRYSIHRNSDSLSLYIQKNIHGDSLLVMMALNRVDEHHFHRPDSIIFPDRFGSLPDYSPFPEVISEIDTAPKMILISYRLQAIGLYEKGKLIRWAPVSLGKKSTPTPTGLFFTNWKAKTTTSTENPEWILNWYFNLDNFRGVSLHEYELPGFPASHACIRLQADVAEFIYYWADQWTLNEAGRIAKPGTPVIIFGKYNFGKRPQWRYVLTDTAVSKISVKELSEI